MNHDKNFNALRLKQSCKNSLRESFMSLIKNKNIYAIKLFIDNNFITYDEIIKCLNDAKNDSFTYVYSYDEYLSFMKLFDEHMNSELAQIFLETLININNKKRTEDIIRLMDIGAKIPNDSKLISELPEDLFIEFIENNSQVVTQDLCDDVILSGNLNMIKYIHEHANFKIDEDSLFNALFCHFEERNLDIYLYIMDIIEPVDRNFDFIIITLLYDYQIEIINQEQYLPKNYILSKEISLLLCMLGHPRENYNREHYYKSCEKVMHPDIIKHINNGKLEQYCHKFNRKMIIPREQNSYDKLIDDLSIILNKLDFNL